MREMITRRGFLEFLGRGAAAAAVAGTPLAFAGCASGPRVRGAGGEGVFTPLSTSAEDRLRLAEGFRATVLIGRGDNLGSGLRFGDCCDFLALFPYPGGNAADDFLLWSNHEYFNPLFVTGHALAKGQTRDRGEVEAEMREVGASIVRVRREGGAWRAIVGDPLNGRLDGHTPIPFAWSLPIGGSRRAIGTVGNCAGGVTPWGTVLTCEEGFAEFYVPEASYFGWETVLDHPPEHYGWVVEADPLTGAAKKLVALGRFGHESATVVAAPDGRCAVYSGDDDNDRCLFKFVAERSGTLERGTLYAADLARGRWLPLAWKIDARLREAFRDQTDVLVRARDAALAVGATRLDRPEDIEQDPATGAMLVTLTNHRKRGNYHGSILSLTEKGGDPLALEFETKTLLAGGPEAGFSCPDNLAFDPKGGLWMTSDISTSLMHKAPYEAFGNNGLFYVPLLGPDAGRAFLVATAPVDAELTGPRFTPDGRTLFLSVQHPGENSRSLSDPSSQWPDGAGRLPRSAVVAVEGETLTRLAARPAHDG